MLEHLTYITWLPSPSIFKTHLHLNYQPHYQHAYQVTTSCLYFVHSSYFGYARAWSTRLWRYGWPCEKRLRYLQSRIQVQSPRQILRYDDQVLCRHVPNCRRKEGTTWRCRSLIVRSLLVTKSCRSLFLILFSSKIWCWILGNCLRGMERRRTGLQLYRIWAIYINPK